MLGADYEEEKADGQMRPVDLSNFASRVDLRQGCIYAPTPRQSMTNLALSAQMTENLGHNLEPPCNPETLTNLLNKLNFKRSLTEEENSVAQKK